MNLLFINLNGWEIPIIFLAILLFFGGGKRIPELMKGLGKGISSFKKGLHDIEDEIKSDPEKKESDE